MGDHFDGTRKAAERFPPGERHPREEKIAPSAWAMRLELRRKFSSTDGTAEAQTRRAGASGLCQTNFPPWASKANWTAKEKVS